MNNTPALYLVSSPNFASTGRKLPPLGLLLRLRIEFFVLFVCPHPPAPALMVREEGAVSAVQVLMVSGEALVVSGEVLEVVSGEALMLLWALVGAALNRQALEFFPDLEAAVEFLLAAR